MSKRTLTAVLFLATVCAMACNPDSGTDGLDVSDADARPETEPSATDATLVDTRFVESDALADLTDTAAPAADANELVDTVSLDAATADTSKVDAATADTSKVDAATADAATVETVSDVTFSATPTVADVLVPTAPTPVDGPQFAPLWAGPTCDGSPPTSGPPPPGDVDTGLSCTPGYDSSCQNGSWKNMCKGYCAKDGHCHAMDAAPCQWSTTGPISYCDKGWCVIAKQPGEGFSQCSLTFVAKQNVLYEVPWVTSSHALDPVDDNPCTKDACDSCTGMSHVPQTGSCRIGASCGQCVAGVCVADAQPAVYDHGFAKSLTLGHPRGLPDGGVLAEVTLSSGAAVEHGLVRWSAAGTVTAQVWTQFPLRQADVTLDSGAFAVTVTDVKYPPHHVALAFDPTTLTLLSPLASDGSKFGDTMDALPIVLPDGTVAASPDGLNLVWGLPWSDGMWDVGAKTLTARQGAMAVVVQSTLVPFEGKWLIPNANVQNPLYTPDYESSWVAPLTGNAAGKWRVTGPVTPALLGAVYQMFGAVTPTTLDGIGYTPAGTLAAWGRVRKKASWSWPTVAAIWLAGDATSIVQTVLFDELPTVEGIPKWQEPAIGGVVLPDGGVAAQLGRAVAWTNGSGQKIGYALLPTQYAGMLLFASWDDGTIGLFDPKGHRLAKIPWSWKGTACP
jgi:hypothetical protein